MPIRLTQFYCPGSQHKGQCPNLTAGEKTPLCAPFIYKNEHFAKTGSGQT
jgi:hypothetical protein